MPNTVFTHAGFYVGSVAERVKAPFLSQPCYHEHDRLIAFTLIGHIVAILDKALYDDYLCFWGVKTPIFVASVTSYLVTFI